jgi:hypothetical protein
MFNLKNTLMKKLILTGCAATLLAIGSIAQVQDTVNNNLRQGVQETQEDAREAGNELRRDAEQTSDEIKQDAQETGNEIKQETQEAGQEAQEAGNEIKQDAQQAGQEIKQDAQDAGNAAEQGAERVGDEVQQGAEETRDRMEMERRPAQENPGDPTSMNAMPPQTEIEVLEDKEGPNNAVVYKYQGGLYYVDRETKQLVEIEESQLKDAEHKAIEHNATAGESEQKKP